MSAISTIVDNMVARIAAVLPSGSAWAELPDAYNLERNPEIMLRQGYAVAIGPATNTKRTQSNILSLARQMTVSVSRAVEATDFAVSVKREIEKQLLEDLRLIVGDFEMNPTLNSGLLNCQFENDTGIQFISQGDQGEFAYIQGTFTIEYFEQL